MSDSVTFKAKIGDTVTDGVTGATGKVTSRAECLHDVRGYWIDALDDSGRPFQVWVDERDARDANGHALA